MQLPDGLIKTGIALEDRFFDLKGLSIYSSFGVSSLRYHIRENGLPHYSVRGEGGQVSKILVKLSEFDQWMSRWKDRGIDIDQIVAGVMQDLKSDSQSEGQRLQSKTGQERRQRKRV